MKFIFLLKFHNIESNRLQKATANLAWTRMPREFIASYNLIFIAKDPQKKKSLFDRWFALDKHIRYFRHEFHRIRNRTGKRNFNLF